MSHFQTLIIAGFLLIGITFKADLVIYIACFAALIALFFKSGRRFLHSLGFRHQENWLKTIGLAFILAMIIVFSIGSLSYFLVKISGFEAQPSIHQIKDNAGLFAFLAISSFITGGFIEEMIFRGFILNRLCRIFPQPQHMIVILIITSIFFGAAHLYQGIMAFFSTALFSLALSFIFIKSHRNLWLCIFTHGFHNSIIFLGLYMGWLA